LYFKEEGGMMSLERGDRASLKALHSLKQEVDNPKRFNSSNLCLVKLFELLLEALWALEEEQARTKVQITELNNRLKDLEEWIKILRPNICA
jgi:hypothetical protein